MELITVILGLTVALVLLAFAWNQSQGTVRIRSSSNSKRFADIPTVPGWPVVGSALMIDRHRHDLTLRNWAKQYGPIYKVKLFNEDIVVVSGYDRIYEMLSTKGPAYAGRNKQFKLSALTGYAKDIINGPHTQASIQSMRKATHRGIRHYGNGLTRLEATLAAMGRAFVDQVRLYEGKPVDLRDDIYNFVVSVAVTMICGKQVTSSADDMVATMKVLEQLMSTILTAEGFELDFYPWLRHFGHPTYKKIQEFCRIRDGLWTDMWRYSQPNYTSDGDATCVMHSIAQLLDKNSPHYDPTYSKADAIGLFSGLIIASILTTSSVAYVMPNMLLHHPHVLKRIQEEVDHVVGTDRQPSIFDRDAMPYSVATILEVMRYGALFTTFSHLSLEDTTLGEYDIPAGTTLWPLYPTIMHDEKLWGDPDVFRPDRFLDSDGSLLPADHPNRKHMLQFGAGPRSCVGEQFALKRLFIVLTSLVHTFDLLPGSETLVPCDNKSYVYSGALNQRPYTIRLVVRR